MTFPSRLRITTNGTSCGTKIEVVCDDRDIDITRACRGFTLSGQAGELLQATLDLIPGGVELVADMGVEFFKEQK